MTELKFPKYKITMHITHNQHKSYYETAQAWADDHNNTMYEWVPGDSRDRAIATDSIWTVQWYPNTPIGFMAVAAATLEEALNYANQS